MTEQPITKPKASILVVDDTPDNLRLLSHILSNKYQVRLIPNALLALRAVQSTPPDLILLDIMMPEMSGYEVAERLKADEQTRDIPIIFISALDDIKSKIQAFQAGGVDYVTKPFQEKEVLARVETHLTLRHLQRELQVANTALAQQVDELRARNQELDAFGHTVAHDLKNPLTNLILYIDLLEGRHAQMSKPEMDSHLAEMAAIATKMTNTIEELMLLSGLHQRSVVSMWFDMGQVVNDALQSFDHMIKQSQAEIITPPAWIQISSHKPWVEQVWVNYISNAIKYGGCPEEGVPPRIELGFDMPPASQPAGQARFWVHDNGPGLTPEQQQLLFVPFERLHNMRVEGHGLGLSIVRRIVERLDGQAGVESTPGQGSLFFFTLPLSVEPQEQKIDWL
jgi:two-component system, sensor histidine kinase and response regulator